MDINSTQVFKHILLVRKKQYLATSYLMNQQPRFE